jgi:hypothetical protein
MQARLLSYGQMSKWQPSLSDLQSDRGRNGSKGKGLADQVGRAIVDVSET